MNRVAVVVDAGYVWAQLSLALVGKHGSRRDVFFDFAAFRALIKETVATQFDTPRELLRIYWFDAADPGMRSPAHIQIGLLSDYKLRMGFINEHGHQKAVDGLITTEIFALAQNRAVSDILLITGDADLSPAVAAAQQMGLRVHLVALDTLDATSGHLVAEADHVALWNKATLQSFASLTDVGRVKADTEVALGTDRPASGLCHLSDGTGLMESLPALNMTDLALKVVEQLRQSAPALVQNYKAGSVSIPHEIDRIVLAICKSLANRFLDPNEKRELRTRVKEILDAAESSRSSNFAPAHLSVA